MPRSPAWIDGKIAVVTGASRGIGRATAVALAEAGAYVVAAARSSEPLERLHHEITRKGGRALAVTCDVSDPVQVERLFTEAASLGQISVLVCAAGVLAKGLVDELALVDWQMSLDVNLTGVFSCCAAAFRLMKKARSGRIVTISSLSGVYATEKFPGLAAYNASKAGVVGLTEAIAVEGKPFGISAICVSPGAVDTEMLKAANPDLKAGLSPEQVGAFITALLDAAIAPANGANIPLFSNE